MRVLFPLQTFSETFLIIRNSIGNQSKISANLHLKELLFLYDLRENWIFLRDVRKICKYQDSWNTVHVYRETDRYDEANCRFSRFDATNKGPFYGGVAVDRGDDDDDDDNNGNDDDEDDDDDD